MNPLIQPPQPAGVIGQTPRATASPYTMAGPHHPPLPDTFNGNLYPPVTHDIPASYIVMEFTITVDDNLTASITAGSPLLKVVSIEVDDVVWSLENGGDGPRRPKPQWIPDFIERGTSDGVKPLAVKQGQ